MPHQITINSANVAIAVTVIIACLAGGYKLGNSDRDDTISNLNLTIKSYEKSNDLQLKDLIDKVEVTSQELKLNVKDQRELNELRDSLDKLKKRKQSDDENYLVEVEQLRKKIEEVNNKLIESQKRYSNILPVVEEKLSIKKNVLFTRDSSIEVLQDKFYLGIGSVYGSSVVLMDNGRRVEIQIGQTITFEKYGTICHVRLMTASSARDEAVFDYGCSIKS